MAKSSKLVHGAAANGAEVRYAITVSFSVPQEARDRFLKLVRANAALDQSSNQPIADFGAQVVDFIEKAVD